MRQQPQVRVGFEFLHIKPIRPAEDPPIEPPQVVARHIFAILGEFDARAAMRTRMPARDVALHRPPRKERQRSPAATTLAASRKLGGDGLGALGGSVSVR